MIESALLVVILGIAAIWVVRPWYAAFTGRGGGCKNCLGNCGHGCERCSHTQQQTEDHSTSMPHQERPE